MNTEGCRSPPGNASAHLHLTSGGSSSSGAGSPPPESLPDASYTASVAALQTASTPCALLGSVAAVVGTWTQDPGAPRPTQLELGAAGLIATSIFLEALALHRRRRSQRAITAHHCPSDLPPDEDLSADKRQPIANARWSQALLLLGPTAAMWGLLVLGGPEVARRLGIVPRTWSGLPGIVLGCFVHTSWSHFSWNALAFCLLGLIVLRTTATTSRHGSAIAVGGAGAVMPFAAVTVFIAISSGLCVWCLARPAIHAGASGVVCGYAGLLFALTLRRRDVPLGPLLMVLGVVACYGSAALLGAQQRAGPRSSYCHGDECFFGRGRSPLYEACTSRTTSAEHHTFGFLSGLAAALLFCRPQTSSPSASENEESYDKDSQQTCAQVASPAQD